ncbi:MAG: exo-alpha-sialidase [Planctomycetes bacterium]|nr:exo-alpha-sialidase [Planctomycetota bacterium]
MHVIFNRSSDGGETWRGFSFIAENLSPEEAVAPALFVEHRKIHVLYATRDGHIRQAVSADEGKSWSNVMTQLDFECWGFKVIASERLIRLCFFGLADRDARKLVGYWYCESADGGKSWSEPVLIGKTRRGDLQVLFEFVAGESMLVAGYTVRGRSESYPKEAKVVISRDGGKTWKDLKLAEGIEGGTGLPKVSVDGTKIGVAFVQVAEEGRSGETKLLFREYAP